LVAGEQCEGFRSPKGDSARQVWLALFILTVNFPVHDDLHVAIIFSIFLFIAVAMLATVWDMER
jgi:hypothetical protein